MRKNVNLTLIVLNRLVFSVLKKFMGENTYFGIMEKNMFLV